MTTRGEIEREELERLVRVEEGLKYVCTEVKELQTEVQNGHTKIDNKLEELGKQIAVITTDVQQVKSDNLFAWFRENKKLIIGALLLLTGGISAETLLKLF